jgi:hypothetical protein
MSLINCPECKHELSTNADVCPNCGFAMLKQPVITRNVIQPVETDTVPKWLIIPGITIIALIGIITFMLVRNYQGSNGNNSNVEFSNTNKKTLGRETTVKTVESNPPNQITVPSDSTTINLPPPSKSVEQVAPKTRQEVPASPTTIIKQSESDKGVVRMEAKILTKNGGTLSAKNERFYLLDEDVESILRSANLEQIESNSMISSLGLSMMYPERYGQFNQKALQAIKKHAKYNVSTDASGKALLNNIKADSYYLFGLAKSKSGFAFWNSPVTINPGENILNLAPASFNEIGGDSE